MKEHKHPAPRFLLYLVIAIAVVGSLGYGPKFGSYVFMPGVPPPPGHGLPESTTSIVSMETYVHGVKFDSQQRVTYSNNTGDSVFIGSSSIFLDVWDDGDVGGGLVCLGYRDFSYGILGYAAWGPFSPPVTTSTSALWLTTSINMTEDKGNQTGVSVQQKTADEESYSGLLGGATCEGATENPVSNPWMMLIPGWESYTPPNTNQWLWEAFSCSRAPCNVYP